MTESLILKKLEQLEGKVDKIETAVGLIAVQSERINNLSNQVNSLWLKYDTAFGSDGVITEVRNWQASCPRLQMRSELNRQWGVITLMATVITGLFLKVIGAF